MSDHRTLQALSPRARHRLFFLRVDAFGMSMQEQKLTRLTAAGRFDLCCPGECIRPLLAAHHVTYNRRAGGCGRMLKVLLNGTCSYDCAYCAVRLERERLSFAPEELAGAFLRLWREGLVGGLFLSSGIARDVDCVMHDLVETGEILRRRGYDGYLHLKILPGAARVDIHDAACVADRISINLEATSPDRLGSIAGVKDYRQDILKRQAWVAEEKPDRHTTQIVLGAADETDAEVLACLADQYRELLLRRTPIPRRGGLGGGIRPITCSGTTALRPMNSGRFSMKKGFSRTATRRRSLQPVKAR